MYDIEVADNQDCLTIPRDRVLEIVRVTLEAERIASATISIAIVDNPTIHDLNRQYLNHDYETDVLSFLLDSIPPEDCDRTNTASGEDDAGSVALPARCSGWTINGEVIVSAEMACDLAPDYGADPLHELTLYIVHGLLHLCGYDDLTADELPFMRARECAVFKLLGLVSPERATDDQGHVGEDEPTAEAQSQSGAATSSLETGGRS
jgi:probable rRNA maturation factor